MAKVYFRYGTMNSGKSIDLLKVAHNYEEQGKNVLLLTPSVDTRSPVDVIASRIGISHEAVPVDSDTEILDIVSSVAEECDIACVLVDEAQFLTYEQVVSLCLMADIKDIPVIAYGLKTDFRGELFDGSAAFIALADKIEEIKTTCHCGRKALFNARYVDGKFTTEGQQVQIGGNDMYKPLCRKHFFEELCRERGMVFTSEGTEVADE